MTEVEVIALIQGTLFATLKISAPILITALIVGFVIGVLQTTTSIQEPTIAFVPKLFAIFFAIVLFGAWMLNVLLTYTRDLFGLIGKY